MSPPDELTSRSAFAAELTPEQRSAVALEAYKKHAAELTSLEGAREKETLLVLGIFAAGASLLGGRTVALPGMAKALLVVIAVVLAGHTYASTWFRNKARRSTRALLVSCERALGFYDDGLYIQGTTLNSPPVENFPSAGGWLGWTSWIAILIAAIAFVVLLLSS